jgi:hypothetical protein
MSKREKVDSTKTAPLPRLRNGRRRVSAPLPSGVVVPGLLQAAADGVREASPVQTPWELKVGAPCSFYHEGGSGDKHWVNGWRYGIVLHIVERGSKKNWVQLEIPVDLWGWNNGEEKRIDGKIIKKKSKPGWVPKPRLKAWCHMSSVNAPGDCLYHGAKLTEIVHERKSAKAEQQAKADKRKRKA